MIPSLLISLQCVCTLALLRNCLNVRKGFEVELAAVGFALLLTIPQAATRAPHGEFVAALLQAASWIAISATLFLVARVGEQLIRRNPILISDLIRLTAAIASICAFAPQLINALAPTVATLAYITSDTAWKSRNRNLLLASSFGSSFLALTITHFILFALPNEHSPLPFVPPTSTGVVAIAIHVLIPTCFISGFPGLVAILARRSRLVHQVAMDLARWRFQRTSAETLARLEMPIRLWHLRPGVNFLNHGSFGAVPSIVQNAQRRQLAQLHDEPIDVFIREFEGDWLKARFQLSVWLGTAAENIALVENATSAMNELAGWFPLQEGDEVLTNNHEYGAVQRIWQRKCQANAATLKIMELPESPTDPSQIADAILSRCTANTRLVVFSHYTSPTAIRLPVEQLCEELDRRGIASCIDGPHALLQDKLRLGKLGCDFYAASCHKWLCAPVGSGFLYIAPKWHSAAKPLRISWGRLPPAQAENWTEELMWSGSRDNSAILCIPDAIDCLSQFDHEKLDRRNHLVAQYARRKLLEIPGTRSLTPDDRSWYGWMVAVRLPPGDHDNLQQKLWENHRIEVHIIKFDNYDLIRVACPLYVTHYEVDHLVRSLRRELQSS